MPLTIRHAEMKDIEILENLFLQHSGLPLERGKVLRKVVKDADSELFVSDLDGEVVGFIYQVFVLDPFHGGVNSYVMNLFVRESHRNLGIGAQLIKKALENAEKRGIIEVHVDTEEDNVNAIRFYEKHGFRKVGIMLEKSFDASKELC